MRMYLINSVADSVSLTTDFGWVPGCSARVLAATSDMVGDRPIQTFDVRGCVVAFGDQDGTGRYHGAVASEDDETALRVAMAFRRVLTA